MKLAIQALRRGGFLILDSSGLLYTSPLAADDPEVRLCVELGPVKAKTLRELVAGLRAELMALLRGKGDADMLGRVLRSRLTPRSKPTNEHDVRLLAGGYWPEFF